jgi:hypothetical protein
MVQVITQHNDVGRTGANLHERLLTTGNVRPGTFGKLFHRPVDGHIYAQPLYMPALAMPGHGTRNVVFVATMHNSVYAFDADDLTATLPLWQRRLEASCSLPDTNIGFLCGHYADIAVEIGIVSTPVIDPVAGTIYLVTYTRIGAPGSLSTQYQHWLHGLDFTTGAERSGSPRQIGATIHTSRGPLTFDSKCQNQRPGLLLTGGQLFIAFASYCDSGPYHGWVLCYDPSNFQRTGAVSVSPNGERAGIWQAGTAVAADQSHHIYFLTGNGSFDANVGNFGDCLVKLQANLGLADWFSPFNNKSLSDDDNDLGSSGVLLLPGTNLLVAGGKEGRLYLIDRSNLGHFNAAGDTQIVQSFQATGVPNKAGVPPPNSTHHIHGSPVHWRGPDGDHVYVWGENDWLRAYKFDGRHFPTIPGAAEIAFKTILNETALGGPSLSAAGGQLGIAWTGTDPDHHVNFETSLDGHTFAGKVTLNETSIDGPGLAFGSDKWFIAWTGIDPDHHVNVIASSDGHNFGSKVTLGETSPFGPALAFGNGCLFLAWVGTDGNHSLNVLSSLDGSHFFNKVTLGDNSASAPGLSFIDGRLYLLWRGTDANHSLNVMESTDGMTFGNKVTLADSSDFHPALIKVDGQFCLAWTGRDSAQSLNTLTGPTTSSVGNKRTFGDHSVAAPALANVRAATFLGWSGTDSPSHVNVTHVLGEPLPTTSRMLAPLGMPGGMLSVSANGSTPGTGIVWASLPFQGDANQHVVPGILRAFDAADVRTELWNSKQNAARDDVGNFAKFCCPTVADGKVYLGTFSGHLAVYGLL